MESIDFSIFYKPPILTINDNVYIVKYDGMNFQITKKKIIKVNILTKDEQYKKWKREHKNYINDSYPFGCYILSYLSPSIIRDKYTYILDDNTEIDGEIIDKYLYDNYGIYSSKENAIKEIKKEIDNRIIYNTNLLIHYQQQLKHWQNKKLVYNKFLNNV